MLYISAPAGVGVCVRSDIVEEETTQETGCPRAWFNASTPGKRIGEVDGEDCNVGFFESREEGNAREDKCVAHRQ